MEVNENAFIWRVMRCHRIPKRCLVIRGWRMPICARCFGSYLGHLTGIIVFIAGFRPAWWLCLALVIPMWIDWSLQRFKGIMSNNCRRTITGLLGGFGISLVQLTVLVGIVKLALIGRGQ